MTTRPWRTSRGSATSSSDSTPDNERPRTLEVRGFFAYAIPLSGVRIALQLTWLDGLKDLH